MRSDQASSPPSVGRCDQFALADRHFHPYRRFSRICSSAVKGGSVSCPRKGGSEARQECMDV